MPEWEVRSATLGDREPAIALMDRAFGEDPSRAALWDWAFTRNPCTPELYYLVADTGSELAAQYAAVPVAMQYQGQPIRGLLSLFTATDPGFQRRGLFRTLAQALYDSAGETCPLVFGFPNEQSAPTFYKHLGWVDVRPFPHLRRPLRNRGGHPGASRAATVAGRVLEAADRLGRDGSVEVVSVDDFTGIADALWEEMAPLAGTAIVRDERFMNWRFVDSPYAYVRLVAMRAGRPVGLAVLAAQATDGRARLMELIVSPSEGAGVTRALLARVVELANGLGAYGIGFVATPRHPQWRQLVAAGLIPQLRLPPSRSPIDEPMSSFGVRVIGPGVAPSRVLHIDDWYLSSADQDWI
jgi:GNAT superfamily N-acetyltransferase